MHSFIAGGGHAGLGRHFIVLDTARRVPDRAVCAHHDPARCAISSGWARDWPDENALWSIARRWHALVVPPPAFQLFDTSREPGPAALQNDTSAPA
jgi:hypothetical protein